MLCLLHLWKGLSFSMANVALCPSRSFLRVKRQALIFLHLFLLKAALKAEISELTLIPEAAAHFCLVVIALKLGV